MIYQIIAIIIWSSSFIAAKYVYTMMDAALMLQFRLAIAALVMLPSCVYLMKKIQKKHWLPLCWQAFANYVIVLFLQFVGLQYTSAASATTIVGLEPILMVFVGHFCFQDKAKSSDWLAGAMVFIGVLLLMMGGVEEHGAVGILGCFMVLLAGLIFALVYRPTQKMVKELGSHTYTSLSLLIGALTCLPFSLALTETQSIAWNWQGSVSLIYLGVCCSWLAYFLWNKGMNHVPANTSGLIISLEPVFGVILAIVLLGEHLSLLSWLGIGLIITVTLASAIGKRVNQTAV